MCLSNSPNAWPKLLLLRLLMWPLFLPAVVCLLCPALQVGELGVVSFGGGGGALPLHPLERPFTDADGVRVMSQASGRLPLPAPCTLAVINIATASPPCFMHCPTRLPVHTPSHPPTHLLPPSPFPLPLPSSLPHRQMRFDQDNTINDRPMVDVITSLDHMLATAAALAGSSNAGASLQ